MAAPEGNQNAVGNKGGGRKSAYQEGADAAMLREMFLRAHEPEDEVQAKLKSGKYSLTDIADVIEGGLAPTGNTGRSARSRPSGSSSAIWRTPARRRPSTGATSRCRTCRGR